MRVSPALGRIALATAALAGLLIATFGAMVVNNRRFAFRDSAHYYAPLDQYVRASWRVGGVPLWLPEENAGRPLLADPTSAAIYPIKILLAFTTDRFASVAYVMIHVVIAYAGLLRVCRVMRVTGPAAVIGALVYAFSGPILGQYGNEVYLVGASWVPWGLAAIRRLIDHGSAGAIAELALALAMQVLGGDPESAYLVGLAGVLCAVMDRFQSSRPPGPAFVKPLVIAGAVAVWIGVVLSFSAQLPGLPLEIHERFAVGQFARGSGSGFPLDPSSMLKIWIVVAMILALPRRGAVGLRSFVLKAIGLGLAGALAAALAGAQLLPSLELAALSDRAGPDAPFEIFGYSLEPQRLLEWLWPGFFGTAAGANTYWMEMTPRAHDHEPWTPSISLGAVVLVFADTALFAGRKNGEPRAPWLKWLLVLFLLGAFGKFGGPLYWSRLAQAAPKLLGPLDSLQPPYRDDSFPRDGFGSFYWLMAALCPGFRSFRFPSKLLTMSVAAMSILAAQGVHKVLSGSEPERRRVRACIKRLLIASGLAVCLLLVTRSGIIAVFSVHQAEVASIYGPFDPPGAFNAMLVGCLHTLVVLGVLRGLLTYQDRSPRVMAIGLCALAALDLAIAHRGLVLSAPADALEGPSKVAALIARAERENPSPGPFRVHRMPRWFPERWMHEAAGDRPSEAVAWSKDSLEAKYGITRGISYAHALGSGELYDYAFFFGPFALITLQDPAHDRLVSAELAKELKKARRLGADRIIMYYPRKSFDLWGARYFVTPIDGGDLSGEDRGFASFLIRSERINPTPEGRDFPEDVQVFRNLSAYPRAWSVHSARFVGAIAGMRQADRQELMREILYEGDELWAKRGYLVRDPREEVWIETSHPGALAGFDSKGRISRHEPVKISRYENDRVVLSVELEAPGFVVLADVFYPGWEATIDGQPAEILKANRAMRALAVTPGRHTIEYRYRPESWRNGLLLSGVGWAIWLAWLVVCRLMNRSKR